MSDISITRFQPASVTREKVNAVTPAENEGAGLGSGGGQQTGRDESEKEKGHPRPPFNNSQAQQRSDDLEDAVASLNAYVQRVQRDIIFDLDGEQEPTVTVIDRESRQVLRQINGEEARRLARQADDDEDLTLFDTRV